VPSAGLTKDILTQGANAVESFNPKESFGSSAQQQQQQQQAEISQPDLFRVETASAGVSSSAPLDDGPSSSSGSKLEDVKELVNNAVEVLDAVRGDIADAGEAMAGMVTGDGLVGVGAVAATIAAHVATTDVAHIMKGAVVVSACISVCIRLTCACACLTSSVSS